MTAEGHLQLFPDHETTWAVVERANESTEKELVRLCKIADYAEIQKIGEFLQTRPSRNSVAMLSIPCGEVDRPTSVEGGQLHRRIRPGSRIGSIEEISKMPEGRSATFTVQSLGFFLVRRDVLFCDLFFFIISGLCFFIFLFFVLFDFLSIFDTEGCSDIDVKVPSTRDPDISVWAECVHRRS